MTPSHPKYSYPAAIGSVVVIGLYIIAIRCQWQWAAFLTPIVAAILISLFIRFRQILIYKELKGQYVAFDATGEQLSNKHFHIDYLLSNLIQLWPTLYVSQTSSDKGDWESHLLVSGLNPLRLSGSYVYTRAGGGSNVGDWGSHTVSINPESKILHIVATPIDPKGQVAEYYLKKATT